MAKRTEAGVVEQQLPLGGGALQPISDTFEPNLAMGGGAYNFPFDLPSGPGGYAPKVGLRYHTGYGNGPFGLGWVLTVPYVEARRPASSGFALEYFLSGAELLVPQQGGTFVPFIGPRLQQYVLFNEEWTTRGPELEELRFGSTPESRVRAQDRNEPWVYRSMLSRISFPGGRDIDFVYEKDGAEQRLVRISWSVFRLELEYEARPDVFSRFDPGFEVRQSMRCRRLVLHHDGLAPDTQIRTYDLEYQQAPFVGTSLLHTLTISGYRIFEDQTVETALPPMTFGYSEVDTNFSSVQPVSAALGPLPPLDGDSAVVDLGGTSLPGVLRVDGADAKYWQNRGGGTFAPPQRLSALPKDLHLSEAQVRFADVSATGTPDLIVGDEGEAWYYPNSPRQGLADRRRVQLPPGVDLGEEGSFLLDLDGNGTLDLLTFGSGRPMVFLNTGELRWSGPHNVDIPDLPLVAADGRILFADMNGDGLPDLVVLRPEQVIYWPSLGRGRFGPPRAMANTPDLPESPGHEGVRLSDIDGDGTADLLLISPGGVRLYLNSAGESFGPEIEVNEALPADRAVLVADMFGSGTKGLVWASQTDRSTYAYRELVGPKPYLLTSIDNGAGLSTVIDYSTSASERSLDLAEGRDWSSTLPFSVQVVKRLIQTDSVTSQSSVTEYRYHDGHYDVRAREFLGFAQVDTHRLATAWEAAEVTSVYFHNRAPSARDPEFLAGKGQPHRTELKEPSTLEIRQVEESTWSARPVPEALNPAYVALEVVRTSVRLDGGKPYEQERIEYSHDDVGNIIREHRRGEWRDRQSVDRVDELIIESDFARHDLHGSTSLPSRVRRRDGTGRVLKQLSYFYDGPDFIGLPMGQVDNGFLTRQTEVALTLAEIVAAYSEIPPLLQEGLLRVEADPDLGEVWVRDTRRYRVDSYGNQLETLDALGNGTTLLYDGDSIHPISLSEDSGRFRVLRFDPISQQAALVEDANGNTIETRYDGLGQITEVFRKGALAGKPTETYEYERSTIPHQMIQQVRLQPDDAQPGWIRRDYLNGQGRAIQTKILSEDGGWVVSDQELLSLQGQKIAVREGWFSGIPDYEAFIPSVARRELSYDFAGRIEKETSYAGYPSFYRYSGPDTQFYGPGLNPDVDLPSRVSRSDAWGRLVSIVESEDGVDHEQRREYDALGRIVQIVDPLGHVALGYLYDLWGSPIRVDSTETGVTTFVYDAGGNEVLRNQANGAVVYQPRDIRGRVIEIRRDGPGGAVEDSFHYDTGVGDNLSGRLAWASGPWGRAEYSYSVHGDPTLIRRKFAGNPTVYELQFSYDTQRNVRSVTYQDGEKVEYHYHGNGKLAAIPGLVNSLEYGESGRKRHAVYANGLETIWTHTPGDHLLQEIVTRPTGGAAAYQHLVHQLDAMGRVVAIDDLSGVAGKVRNNQTFHYDQRNRLARATGRGTGGTYEFEYRYDALGNLIFSGEGTAELMDYGHQLGDHVHPNRLVKRRSAGSAEYQYDPAGYLTFDPAVGRMTYDARQRLVRVERRNGTVIDYDYDHADRRVRTRVTTGGTTRERYDVEGLYLIEDGVYSRIVMDDDYRRLAVLDSSGNGLLFHYDRLGNVNVVSNLITGAFVGNNEYTPYGQLTVAVRIEPQYSFQGGRFDDGIDILLLGTRWYRPAFGRFLTGDRALQLSPDRIPGVVVGVHLYVYGLDNPVNFTDPSGRWVFLGLLVWAAIVGAAVGAIGAAMNGVSTWQEFLLWVIGGTLGGVLAALTGGGFSFLGGQTLAGALVGLLLWSTASLLGSLITPALDRSSGRVAWFFSFLIKWVQSPILTTLGLIVALGFAIAGSRWDLRRGMLFVEAGPGNSALTLGAIGWVQSGSWSSTGVQDDLAQHESHHGRTVVALGELGFYFTYLTVGTIWAAAEGGAWNKVNVLNCGNPFEDHAYDYTPGDRAPAGAGSSPCA